MTSKTYDLRLYGLAKQRGWNLPSVYNTFPAESWNHYWREMEKAEQKREAGDSDPGRPVPPHRSG